MGVAAPCSGCSSLSWYHRVLIWYAAMVAVVNTGAVLAVMTLTAPVWMLMVSLLVTLTPGIALGLERVRRW